MEFLGRESGDGMVGISSGAAKWSVHFGVQGFGST